MYSVHVGEEKGENNGAVKEVTHSTDGRALRLLHVYCLRAVHESVKALLCAQSMHVHIYLVRKLIGMCRSWLS